MESTITLLLIGGLISLISTLAGIFSTHWLEMRKLAIQVKSHPTEVLYNKQTEFFDKLAPIIAELNRYITGIDVWLWEKTDEAEKQVKRAATNNQSVTEFYDLLQRYYIYLPKKLVQEANELHSECMELGRLPSLPRTQDCIYRLFSFQNSVRGFVGVDALSQDLLKAFGSKSKAGQEDEKK